MSGGDLYALAGAVLAGLGLAGWRGLLAPGAPVVGLGPSGRLLPAAHASGGGKSGGGVAVSARSAALDGDPMGRPVLPMAAPPSIGITLALMVPEPPGASDGREVS